MHPSAARIEARVATAVVVVLFVTGAVLAYTSVTPQWAKESLNSSADPLGLRNLSFGGILLRNLGVLLSLYAGVITGGLLTAVTLTSLSLYVGATFAVSVHNAQLLPVLQSVAWYLPWELGAFVLAASIGLRPIVAAALPRCTDSPRLGRDRSGRYLAAAHRTLRPLGIAVGMLVVAAAAESLTIALR